MYARTYVKCKVSTYDTYLFNKISLRFHCCLMNSNEISYIHNKAKRTKKICYDAAASAQTAQGSCNVLRIRRKSGKEYT